MVRTSEYDLSPEMLDDIVAQSISNYRDTSRQIVGRGRGDDMSDDEDAANWRSRITRFSNVFLSGLFLRPRSFSLADRAAKKVRAPYSILCDFLLSCIQVGMVVRNDEIVVAALRIQRIRVAGMSRASQIVPDDWSDSLILRMWTVACRKVGRLGLLDGILIQKTQKTTELKQRTVAGTTSWQVLDLSFEEVIWYCSAQNNYV